MKRIIKITAYILLTIAVLASSIAFYFINRFENGIQKRYDIEPAMVEIPSDSISLDRGLRLSVGCRNCHGIDLAGSYFFDDPSIGKLASSNLTRAKGSNTENYSDKDWIRALRHGLNPEGKALFVMPSESYTHLSDKDLGCLIAYLKTIPPKSNSLAPPNLTTFAKVLAGAGQFGELYAYNRIDHHKAKNIEHIKEVPSTAYGQYLTKIGGCVSCHQPNFAGGKSPDPVSPPVPNISKSGNPGKWTREQFIQVFRTGKTPEDKILDSNFMPFQNIGSLDDEEIGSIYDYIMSLPGANVSEI